LAAQGALDNPLLVEEDGSGLQLCAAYQQFYVDAADVAPRHVDRFEFLSWTPPGPTRRG